MLFHKGGDSNREKRNKALAEYTTRHSYRQDRRAADAEATAHRVDAAPRQVNEGEDCASKAERPEGGLEGIEEATEGGAPAETEITATGSVALLPFQRTTVSEKGALRQPPLFQV